MTTITNSEVSEVSGVQPNGYAGFSDTPVKKREVSGVSVAAKMPKIAIIPNESNRPRFVVLDDWHAEGAAKYRPGVWHFGVKQARSEAPATLTQQWICSPLHLDAVTTDAHAGNYGRLLRIKTTLGKWVVWAMPMMMLRGDCSDLRGELLAMGVEIDTRGRNLLAEYLQDRAPSRRIECALQTGWAGTDYKAFVLPDCVIGPRASGVAYQSGERGSEEYATAGTLAGWQAGISQLAVGNPLLVLGLCAAFAGPVLARCGQESGGIHFIGDSSTGKTTIIEAACSVWGGSGFRRSWRTTGNGLEGAAALFNDSLLALDEISECDPRQVGEVVYMLGNGRGKQRASRTGAARAVMRWRSSVLSTGERSIATTMTEGGMRIKAGQSVRLLDVPAQRTYGAWDNLHQLESGTVFSDAIKRASVTDYGHAGRAFLEKLTREHDYSFSEALDMMKALPELQSPGDEGQAKRAASRFAVLALAGELATEYGITGWTKGEATQAAGVGFAAWQALRGVDLGNAERHQIIEKITGFIERHGDSRFSDADSHDDQRAAMVRDRAGWWRSVAGERIYLFNADGMREALKGFDFNRALDALQQAGVIDKAGADGKRAKYIRIQGQGVKLYFVQPARNEGVAS
jgi:putative DNA primase/helicase